MKYTLIIVNILLFKIYYVFSTIDINLSELEYLALHLDHTECNRLIAALHYTTYDLPSDISGAERLVSNDITCLEHLIHWNSTPGEGKGKTHTTLAHRLHQINRSDLADWLGSTVFRQLTKDLFRSMNKPLSEQAKQAKQQKQQKQQAETQFRYQIDESSESHKENIWKIIDVILISILSTLSIAVLLLIIAYAIDHLKIKKSNKNKSKKSKKIKKRLPVKVCYKNACYCQEEQVGLLNCQGQPTDVDLQDDKTYD